MRYIIAFVLLLILIIGGFWVYEQYKKTQPQQPGQEQTPEQNEEENTATKNTYDTIADNSNLKNIKALIDKSSLKNELVKDDKYTLFLASDSSLAEASKSEINNLILQGTTEQVDAYLKNHVIRGEYYTKNILEQTTKLKNLNDKDMNFKVENGILFVNEVEALDVDLQAKNGVIYLLEDVLK